MPQMDSSEIKLISKLIYSLGVFIQWICCQHYTYTALKAPVFIWKIHKNCFDKSGFVWRRANSANTTYVLWIVMFLELVRWAARSARRDLVNKARYILTCDLGCCVWHYLMIWSVPGALLSLRSRIRHDIMLHEQSTIKYTPCKTRHM